MRRGAARNLLLDNQNASGTSLKEVRLLAVTDDALARGLSFASPPT